MLLVAPPGGRSVSVRASDEASFCRAFRVAHRKQRACRSSTPTPLLSCASATNCSNQVTVVRVRRLHQDCQGLKNAR